MMAVTDKDCTVVWQAKLSDNGQAQVAAGSIMQMPLRGSNQYEDTETGLHYNVHRYLDARQGRYLSPDPIGLAAGPDLYRFALGQPHRFVDPLRLMPTRDWSVASYEDKLKEIINRAAPMLPTEVGNALLDMVKPENLAIMGAVFTGFVAMQSTPLGWIADAALLGYGAWMFGSGLIELIKTFIRLDLDVRNAKCDPDLTAAATRLARGFVTSGGEVAAGLAGFWGTRGSGGFKRIADGINALIDFGKVAKGLAGVPGRVRSRINLSNEGMEHVIARHFSGKANASQFLISEAELRSALLSKEVVGSPIVRTVESANKGTLYIREFDAGRVIGTDKFTGYQPTSVITIVTDRFGNLVSAFPGVLK